MTTEMNLANEIKNKLRSYYGSNNTVITIDEQLNDQVRVDLSSLETDDVYAITIHQTHAGRPEATK